VSYNGELYNDAELRRELGPWLAARGARFETACDTETVLRAIERWGGGAFDRLRGMYAVVAYDARSRELWLARDPLGI
jgi:asparagine synthase (glutamine-hydrolysing)